MGSWVRIPPSSPGVSLSFQTHDLISDPRSGFARSGTAEDPVSNPTKLIRGFQQNMTPIGDAPTANGDASSPCTKVCTLDEVTGFCLGCGRTGAEIGGWLAMSAEERIAVKALLPERLARLQITADPTE